MSSFDRPAAAVLMMTPPVKPCDFAELAHDAPQPAALVPRLDLPRDADVIHRRHEHQEAAGHGDVRGQARAFGAERLLDDLDEDFLALLEQVLDPRLRLRRRVLVLGLLGSSSSPASSRSNSSSVSITSAT